MQIFTYLQGEPFKNTMKGIGIGAVLTWAIGFGLGGWTLGSTAEKMAADRTSTALVNAYTSTCAENFFAQPDGEAKAVALRGVDSWLRDAELAKTGFATLPGETEPNMRIAYSCANAIVTTK